MSEELQSAPPHPQPSQQLPPLPPRLSVHDIRNSDLVSRYMAATPPYLYSSPVGPQNFFFSDMLRSIVQNRNAEQAARNANSSNTATAGVQPLGRRSRKRTWGQTRAQFDAAVGKEGKIPGGSNIKGASEKPLELTNKCQSPLMKIGKSDLQSDNLKSLALKHSLAEYAQTQQLNNNNNLQITTEPPSLATSTATPSSDLVLPPPPPMWYPPLYPPYGIDPLHFFIDLRVSGHIYDRKKENTSPNSNPSANLDDSTNIVKPRLGSAFSVPPSRRDNKSPSSRALNLTATSPTSGEKHTFNHTYDHSIETASDKESSALLNGKNTNYVLQNLPRIYTDLSSSQIGGGSGLEERNSVHSDETTDSKSELDATDATGNLHVDGQHGSEVHDVTDRDEDSNDVVIVDNKHSSGY